MKLHYEQDFIEAAVFVCATGRRNGIPSLQIARFHREREQLYRLHDPEERNAAFFKLHLDWFREWNLENVLTDVVKEFRLLSGSLSFLGVRQARGKTDEGAELYVNQTGQRSGILALRAQSFALDPAIGDYLRHELTHLSDMLDPFFGYSPLLDLPGLNGAQQRLASERYRLLWDISIDGRLAAKGHRPMQTQEQHAGAFGRGYSFWPEEKQASVFRSIWEGQTRSHSDFLTLIADPRGLRDADRPVPGAACPLCEFPTFAWAPEQCLSADILHRIQFEFPDWHPQQGLCSRCLETYEAVGSNGVAVKL